MAKHCFCCGVFFYEERQDTPLSPTCQARSHRRPGSDPCVSRLSYVPAVLREDESCFHCAVSSGFFIILHAEFSITECLLLPGKTKGGRKRNREGAEGKRANGRHPTGSVSRARCQRLARAHTVYICPASLPQGIPHTPCRVDHVHQQRYSTPLLQPGGQRRSSWDAILQVDDSFRGTKISSGGEKWCRAASATPALGQEELIPRCRTVRKTRDSGD